MQKALHICMDHNFVTNSRRVFEHYYPGKNIFVVNSTSPDLKIIKDKESFEVYDLNKPENVAKVVDMAAAEGVDKVVLHGMSYGMIAVVERLKKLRDAKVYWLFWGYELYDTLCYEKGYRLIDEHFMPFRKESYFKPNRATKMIRRLTGNYKPDTVLKLLPMVDYFCFWSRRDYDLLRRYFDYPIEYRFFAYGANWHGKDPDGLFPLEEGGAGSVMINHQASFYGNHNTVFKALKRIDKDNRLEKIVPLSYGNTAVRERTLRLGKKYFGAKFNPVLDYMPASDYFNILRRVDVALFGQRRQEASGNIIQLLKNGVRVYLRNDNNLLDYYREKGYIIFSIEDDLRDEDSLRPLSMEEKRHNRECYLGNLLYYDDFMPDFFA